MCGIFAYIGDTSRAKRSDYNKIKHRGPDNTTIKQVNDNILFVFHRLVINGLDHSSDQPLCIRGKYLICNGEIYNYKQLCLENGFDYQTSSDCEIIIHMFEKYGIENTVKSLDGVFAFVLYDSNSNRLYAARDPIGIRSLYYSQENGDLSFASEAKSLVNIFDKVQQFPSGHYWDGELKSYYQYNYPVIKDRSEEEICGKLRELLERAVDKRMMTDRRVCTLLSGGLDSTLITALVKKHYPDYGLDTYAIGLEGSVDLYYARKASEELRTRYFELVVSEEEFLDAIEKTIYQIESFCVTSVRASVGNYLISLYIKNRDKHQKDEAEYNFKDSGDTVVFCGDLSDEVFASYRGFQKADTPENFYSENVKLVRDVRFFDVLRSDKSISGAGLEARVPFADKAFVGYAMSIQPELKMFDDTRMEKYLLRKAFEGELSEELLWRRKEAFSDGVSSHSRSWFEIIREYVDKKIPNSELEERCSKYEYMKPYDKESLYYREVFEKYYPGNAEMIPYYWKHPFTESVDPSARLLDFYKK